MLIARIVNAPSVSVPVKIVETFSSNVKQEDDQLAEEWARKVCYARGLDPDEICADGGVTAWMVVLKEANEEYQKGDDAYIMDGVTVMVGKQSTTATEKGSHEERQLAIALCYSFKQRNAVYDALNLALSKLIAYEPGDSRAVSDDFVAMAAILANPLDVEAHAHIIKSLAEIKATKS